MTDTLLVVGAQPEWAAAAQEARCVHRVLFYTLEGNQRLSEEPEYLRDTVDVTAMLGVLESVAWSLTTSLTDALSQGMPGLSEDAIWIAKRQVFMHVMWPIARARALAREVRRRCPDVDDVRFCGVSKLEAIALAEVFPRARSCDRGDDGSSAGGSAANKLPFRAWRVVRGLALGLGESLTHRCRSWQTTRDLLGRGRGKPTVIRAAVLAFNDTYTRLFASALSEMRSRGWRLSEVQVSPNAAGRTSVDAQFDETVELQPLIVDRSLGQRVVARARRAEFASVITRWVVDSELTAYQTPVVEGVQAHYWRANALMEAHALVLRRLNPDIVLCVNETDALVEAVVPAARRRGIPTVNVQHGVIADTLRRASFDFNLFCVFGAGYADMLESLGTDGRRIRVVGNPYLDHVLEAVGPGEGHGTVEQHEGPWRILFAAQHSRSLVSDYVLYYSLKVVLEWLEDQNDIDLILKLHPLGAGGELGYDVALAEHPRISPRIVRDGDLFELLAECDCVATYSSTVGLEAASFKKPVVVVAPESARDYIPPVEEGVGFRATSSQEFGARILDIRSGVSISSSAYGAFERRYAFARDGQAGRRIADACSELIAVSRGDADGVPQAKSGTQHG